MRIERVARVAGTPFEPGLPEPLTEPVARVVEVQGSVVVLGSRQRVDLVDPHAAEAAGVEVVGRRTGGGAVLLHAGRSLWIDVLLPRNDERWVEDVGVSFHWLGAVWADALGALGVAAEVHRGGLTKTGWGALICFGSVGPGEVVIDGRKVVGISQRRTRVGALFQCLVHETWAPDELLDLLVLTTAERTAAAEDMRDRAAGPGVPLGELEHALLARLSRR